MPNLLDATGLQTATRDELVAEFTADFQAVYGSDINLGSNTPDGQMLNIFVQAILDLEDLLVQIHAGFDPDYAVGVILDQRCALNGVIREGGSFSTTDISLTIDRPLSLVGLDGDILDPNGTGYTIADNAGNQWVLVTSTSFGGEGVYTASFRAQDAGAVLTAPNSIQIPVTVVLGVTAVNNPNPQTATGINEETDAQLRVRRQRSVSISSQGYLSGLLAALLNVNGVTAAFVYENVTGTTDGDGIPGHSIWVIVQGGDNADIANTIYSKRNAGAGMKGSTTQLVTQLDGTTFLIKWDIVQSEALFIKMTLSSLNGTDAIDEANIRAQLAILLTPGVYARVDINHLATLVQSIDPNALVTNAGFSTSATGTFTTSLLPSAKNLQFAVLPQNIILLPVIALPATYTMVRSTLHTFTATGGYGAYTWSVTSGGGSVVSGTGVFTAPGSAATVVLRATDTLGNYGETTITVT